MPRHIAWTDIENFHSMRRSFQKRPDLLPDGKSVVTYRGKVKLHGTNAGIAVDADGTVYAMSRTSVITPENDNVGFAKWVDSKKDALAAFAPPTGTIVLYGEWCGPGIQKGVAISQIKERAFVVFAAFRIEDDKRTGIIVEPIALKHVCEKAFGHEYDHVIPWFNDGEQFTVDWAASAEDLEDVLSKINARVAEVEACDPFTSKQFGVDGTGEGLVMYPVGSPQYDYFSALVFKAKGEKHQVVARTKPAQADAAKAEDVQAFVDIVLPVARLEQGMSVVSPDGADQRFIPHFLKWVHDDVVKECQAELEASGLDQKNALRAVTAKARLWYIDQAKKL